MDFWPLPNLREKEIFIWWTVLFTQMHGCKTRLRDEQMSLYRKKWFAIVVLANKISEFLVEGASHRSSKMATTCCSKNHDYPF